MLGAQEGNLYKTLTVEGTVFHIRYGYYSDAERQWWPPAPIYPDFTKSPQFTPCGKPFTRADQDVCQHYLPREAVSGEDWCNDCAHFQAGDDIIGTCKCKHRRDNLRQNE